ncbi:amidase [Mangrovibacterium diazotrophicum]|uniref:Amidase n=1 Tax=Mangrovibacterium diazotrophicum TaxID=1261403 RepID=A0A419WA48_9BACT|nr:amidase [Mangrovibacterium diazotrophicum]RKD92345.1 amidase [Mangrovibacterium diazotrophicum]
MKRRNFVKSAIAGGSALSIAGISACSPETKQPVDDQESVDLAAFDLNEFTVGQFQQFMADGELSSVELCRKYLARIELVDPFLKSVIELNPDALEIAKQMDDERAKGQVRGPLHGIPILIKDNIDTGDKMMTTAGSLALAGTSAPDDAFIVKKLRAAGAVLLGKTNLSEWANIRSTISSSGWSGRGGQVRNPFCLDRSPCGSSSGTGAAISANLCAIGIGSETDGSIVCPSGINGIVGVKPTLGMWSRDGIIPISHSQDTAGPMCRTVKDAAILLGALAEFDPNDAETHLEKGPIYSDYTQFLKRDGLKGSRIGVVRNMFPANREVAGLAEQAIADLRRAGAEIVDKLELTARSEWEAAEWTVLITELKADMASYLESRTDQNMRTLADLIVFNKTHAEEEMPWFGQEIFEQAEQTKGLNDPEYLEALKNSKEKSRNEGIDRLMDEHQLDALIAPTNGPSWPIDWVNGDNYTGGSSDAGAVAGYPSVTVPAGFLKGLPIGISFFGRAWSEPVLLKLAFAYEQSTMHRQSPDFKRTIS